MTKYLLDTNIPLYLEDPASPFHNSVKESFQKLQDEDQLFVMEKGDRRKNTPLFSTKNIKNTPLFSTKNTLEQP